MLCYKSTTQWSMVNGQWSMVNGQWSMVNGQATKNDSTFTKLKHNWHIDCIYSSSFKGIPYKLYEMPCRNGNKGIKKQSQAFLLRLQNIKEVCFDAFEKKVMGVILSNVTLPVTNDHTIMTAPLPVCSAKLSMIWTS